MCTVAVMFHCYIRERGGGGGHQAAVSRYYSGMKDAGVIKLHYSEATYA